MTVKKGRDNKHMSKYEAQNKYNQANYFKVALRIPKDKKSVLEDLADEFKMSINRVIINAIERHYGVDLSSKTKSNE